MVHKIRRRLADRVFSQVVRMRDLYTCVRCKTRHDKNSKGLHASHFYNRSRESTRFVLANVDSLCLACHLNWSSGHNRSEYFAYKKKQLGEMGMKNLLAMAKSVPYQEGKKKQYILENDARVIKWCREMLQP